MRCCASGQLVRLAKGIVCFFWPFCMVLFGVFRRKEIEEFLKIRREL